MSSVPDVLQTILQRKAEEIEVGQRRHTLAALRTQVDDLPPTRDFRSSIEGAIAGGRAAVIAEIKRASPSKGVLRDPFDPVAIARSYAQYGAACLSVLTDRDFFQGDDTYLAQVRECCALPALRKEFLVDPWQLYQSRVLGADAVLLIAAALPDSRLDEFHALALELGMAVLVEVHDDSELQRALSLQLQLLGINNRDLRRFETRLQTTLELAPMVPTTCRLVTESGIRTREDVHLMRSNGIEAFLVGEAFMRAEEPGQQLAELFNDDKDRIE